MRILCGTILAAVAVSLSGAASAAPFNVLDFGAKGDGVAKDTAAIQKAVDACSAAGGGTVEVPPGVYLSGTIYLKSHVDFCVGPGATIKGSPDREDYNAYDVCPQNGRSITENASGAHLFMCIEQKNVTLRGPGTIDGNGAAFMLRPDGKHYERQAIPWRPSQMVYFVECEDVRVRDIRLRNPAYWTLFLHGCTHVFVRGVDIRTGRTWHSAVDCYIYQGDGIDVDCCQHVSISDCHVRNSDDGITLRASGGRLKRPQDTRYVTVNNCTVPSSSCAFRFGVGNGKISDVTVSNIVIWDSRVALDFCTSWGTNGVSYANMLVDNVAVADCRWFLRASYHGIKGTDMRGLRFSNIRAKASENALIWGYPEHPISDVRFVNVDCNMPIELINCENCEIVGGTLKSAELSEPELDDRRKKIADGYHPN